MNHKTIRAYQFKADEAIIALESAGAQWVVGDGKPRWELNVQPKVDVEAIKKQARKEFLEEIMAIGNPNLTGTMPVEDNFELGPQQFPNRGQYIGKKAVIRRIPSWHKLSRDAIGLEVHAEEIAFLTKTRYKGYAIVFTVANMTAWLPLSCIEFKL